MTEVKEKTIEQEPADVQTSGTMADKKQSKAKEKESADTTQTPPAKPVDAAQDKPVVDGKMAKFIEWIESISVLELSQLVKVLEDRFGVTAAVPMAMSAVGAGEAGGQAKDEEKTEFDAVLIEFGAQKIAVIKEVRAITGLGLKDSKDLVEAAPKSVKEGVSKEQAEQIKSKIEAVGGTVEIK